MQTHPRWLLEAFLGSMFVKQGPRLGPARSRGSLACEAQDRWGSGSGAVGSGGGLGQTWACRLGGGSSTFPGAGQAEGGEGRGDSVQARHTHPCSPAAGVLGPSCLRGSVSFAPWGLPARIRASGWDSGPAPSGSQVPGLPPTGWMGPHTEGLLCCSLFLSAREFSLLPPASGAAGAQGGSEERR